MERWKATLKKATNQVNQAGNEDLEIRILYTGMAIENFLKAILMKTGNYVDEKITKGGDRHHICKKLFNKIKTEKLMNDQTIEEMEKILFANRLIYMDQKFLGGETTAGYYPHLRYPVIVDGIWIDICENLDLEMLQEKYDLLLKFRDLILRNL